MDKYTYEQAFKDSVNYFNGDELAAKAFLDKYALRNNNDEILENTPEKMHVRLASEFARIQKNKYKSPLSKDTIFNLLNRFEKIIPQGSPMFGIGNNFQVCSISNCFVLDIPEDSYNSILDVDKQLVNISKRRGGVGIDLSKLRPRGSVTNNAARSSTGIISWMERYSNSIREVGQHGRRGALMLTLSVHHPDVLDFSTVKNDNSKVTGANISVRLSQEFLDAVKNDSDYELRFPVDYKEAGQKPKVSKFVKAKEIWKTIIKSAWMRAEPGLVMWDNVLKGPADCYEKYRSVTSNPCCLATSKDCFVKTKSGLKEIKTITSDDLVWVTDQFSESWAPTSGYFESGVADVYEVRFSNGQIFYITKNHKLAVSGDFLFNLVPLAILNVGDFVLDENGNHIKIESIEYYSTEKVGCINVPSSSFFVTDGGLISGNSEIFMPSLESCRLLAINLFGYVKNPFTKNSYFDYDEFYKETKIAQRLMDDVVDLESEKIDQIIAKVKSDPESEEIKKDEINLWERIKKLNDECRRTGLGITAIGDTLAAIGVKYGSEESIAVTEKIYQTLKLAAYESSIEMAEELGSFKDYDAKKEENCEFIQLIKAERPDLYERMVKVGRRNIALTTTAPTGTVSLMAQTSSGIEPVFSLGYKRRKKINPNDKNGRIDFVDQNGDSWQEFMVYHHKVKQWIDVTGNDKLEDSPWWGATANEIDWINRVKLQAAAQKHVCHAISSTINLPETVTEEKVAEIYETAFASGVKGITIYRDNCRTGVLVSKEEKKKENKINHNNAPKRPQVLDADVHHLSYQNNRYYVVVGLLEKDPYEIFIGLNNDGEGDVVIPKSIKSGSLAKEGKGKYVLKTEDFSCVLKNTHTDENADVLARMLSSALRHGCSIEFLTHQLEKTKGGLTSFSKILSRAIKKYIKDGVIVSGEACPECGGKLVRESGCKICKGTEEKAGCGWTACN